MTVHGTAWHLKNVMIILEISDRTVSSIKLRITFAYMRYAFNYRHVGSESAKFSSLSRQLNDENRKKYD
jgi:hypothetical protein